MGASVAACGRCRKTWAQFFAVVCSPRPKRGRQNAPGAAIVCRARGCPGLALLFVLVRSMPNRPPSIARQAQAAISLIAKNQHSSTKTAGSSTAAPARPKQPGNPGLRTALASSAGQCIELDQAHGGTHPAKSWPAARAARTRPRAGHQNAPGAVIARRARGGPGLALLCGLGRLKVNRPLGFKPSLGHA